MQSCTHLRIIEAVCRCKHPARVNEAATTQELVDTQDVLEDASYPRLRLNLSLPSTNDLEVLADASLTTCTLCEEDLIQISISFRCSHDRQAYTLLETVLLKVILLTTLIYVAGCFFKGESTPGVTPGPAPSIWVSGRYRKYECD